MKSTLPENKNARLPSPLPGEDFQTRLIEGSPDCIKVLDLDGRLLSMNAGGMKALADCLHSNGLKFGMYSCAGTQTCGGYPGSWGHEFQDARLFAEWGVD